MFVFSLSRCFISRQVFCFSFWKAVVCYTQSDGNDTVIPAKLQGYAQATGEYSPLRLGP